MSKKQRKANAASSKWSFAELQNRIAYKALMHGSMVIQVDAHATSKACPMCGQTCGKKRPNKGLLFLCQNCHDTLHSDLVGARKSALRTLLIRQDWVSTGEVSDRPDVSDREAKAARLQRDALLAVESRHKPLGCIQGSLTSAQLLSNESSQLESSPPA